MTQQEGAAVRGRVPGLWLSWMAVGLALASTLVVANVLAGLPPLPGRPQADGVTGMVSVIADLVARLAGLFTLGGLAAIVAFTRAGEDHALTEISRRIAGWAGRAGQVWLVSSLLMTAANPAFVTGAPLATALRPDGWWLYLTSTPSGLAWLVTTLAALATTVVAYTATRTPGFAVCWAVGALATIFVAVTGNVTVGLDHDWATDAQALAALAGVVLGSGAVAVVLAALAGSDLTEAAVRRYHRTVVPPVVLLAAGYALVAWQQLAGHSPFAVPAGLPYLVGAACLAAILVNWGWRQSRLARAGGVAGAAGLGSVARDVAMLVLAVAAVTAMTHIPPPRFEVEQSLQINYLGYEVDLPATIERLAGLGRPNLLWVTLCLTAIGLYLWGMARVRRAGGRWPVSRLIPWLAGWGLMLYLAVSGLWMYSTAVFSWHMLVHMTVNMMVPLLVVLGGPLGLLSAASAPPGSGELPGPADLLEGLGANRFVRFLLSPPVLWINYIASLFVVYFTPLFPWMMRYHWAHQLMLLHFMLAGFLFFNLLVSPDQNAGKLPPIVRFAMLISVMPFHAIFAVGIMMARSVIGEQFYESLAVEWVGPLLADQDIAGQITWFTGEIPAFIAVAVLAFQWFRSDSRDAARVDREADEGSDEMAAYNELLAELAERDRRESGRGPR
ncbi:MAG: cytochrome c oxidase assembly protein [Actinobacteria bacterium]|nr:cytochrome c oxidase assembly protein [Actinomycetota bacterium]